MGKLDSAVDVSVKPIVKESSHKRRWIKPVMAIALLGAMLSACGTKIEGAEMTAEILDGRIVDVNLSEDASLFQPESEYFQRFNNFPEVWVAEENDQNITSLCDVGANSSGADSNLIIKGCSIEVDDKNIVVVSSDQSPEERQITKAHEVFHALLRQYLESSLLSQGEREFIVRQMTLEWTVWDLIKAENLDVDRQAEVSRELYQQYTDSSLLLDQSQLPPEVVRFMIAMDSAGGKERSRSLSHAILETVVSNLSRTGNEKVLGYDPYHFQSMTADIALDLGISNEDVFDFYVYK